MANDAKKAAAPLDDWLRQNYFNDGVRLNIRPFLNATLRKGGRYPFRGRDATAQHSTPDL